MPAGNNKPNGIIPQKNVTPIARAPTTINTNPTNPVLNLVTNVTTKIPIYMKNAIIIPRSNRDNICFVSVCFSRAVTLDAL